MADGAFGRDQVASVHIPPIPEQVRRGEALQDRVRALLPTLAANAGKAEAERKVPEENIRLLREAGFTRALQPLAYGGLELSPEQYCPLIVDIAGACASTAWVAGLLAQHGHGLALMSKAVQDEVWADPEALLSSSVAPINEGKAVDGGVILSGRFGWSSGCDHAQWACLGFRKAVPELGGMMLPFYAVVPRKDYAILDDWHVAGLAGTGSKTLELKEVFVPEHRIDSVIGMNTGASKGYGLHDGGIYRAAFVPYFSFGFSAVAVGVARRFLDVYADKTAGRVRAYTGAQVGQTAPAYMRLAEATHMVRAAQATLSQDWAEIASRSRSGQLPSAAELAMWRTNQAYATRTAIGAVNLLFAGSGGSAWFLHNEMQRLWRDANMAGAHAYSDYDIATQRLGRDLLGLEPDMAIF
ncbi:MULTISPECIES: acyl-CoA dehydrogenase family protein [Phenylobacterium]|jgi:alkylation response protein AidB-like acyl-CoA dehydrogenase|uniref:Acyl-CoA dehydrogenase family protein n=1 Tax=Phenylobacterium conjunctum TaxID=1298959 RepID=A0ABW3T3I0_9CAUL